MIESNLKNLSSVQLFRACVSNYNDNRYWEEFTTRYNLLLTRGIKHGYRRFGRDKRVPEEVLADIIQDVYLEILKDGGATLERFKGCTEQEAQAFLVRLAANITSNHLRRIVALKRRAPTKSYDETYLDNQDAATDYYTEDLATHELVQILRSKLSGEHRSRDILLFMLHTQHGLTITELASRRVFNLKPSSIAQIIRRIRGDLKKTYTSV